MDLVEMSSILKESYSKTAEGWAKHYADQNRDTVDQLVKLMGSKPPPHHRAKLRQWQSDVEYACGRLHSSAMLNPETHRNQPGTP